MVFIFVGCAPSNKVASTPVIIVKTMLSTEIPTVHPTATMPPAPTATQTSFVSTTYKDEANRFQLEYPAGWTLIPFKQIGSRGGQAQLYSPGSTAEMLIAGGTRLTISVYDWDPKNDLNAYVTQRKTAWAASGQKIIRKSEGKLADGRGEMHFIVESLQKEQTFFLYTTIGEKYLQIAGDGDLALLEEIARTVRPLE
jgi:hypothetical protein